MSQATAEPKYVEVARLYKSNVPPGEIASKLGVSKTNVYSFIKSFNTSQSPAAVAARKELGEIILGGNRKTKPVKETDDSNQPEMVVRMTFKNSSVTELTNEIARLARQIDLRSDLDLESEKGERKKVENILNDVIDNAEHIASLRVRADEVADEPKHVGVEKKVEV
jgi:hypothetical protein